MIALKFCESYAVSIGKTMNLILKDMLMGGDFSVNCRNDDNFLGVIRKRIKNLTVVTVTLETISDT